MRIAVFCGSSKRVPAVYLESARLVGGELARRGHVLIYGGGRTGLMGALADGALAQGGHVTGVLPRFMSELEWGHGGLPELRLVEDLRTRKHLMLSESDAVIALPGGSGTFEELLEAITLKRLGLFVGPIVLVNTRRFFDPLLELLRHAVEERFITQQTSQFFLCLKSKKKPPKKENSASRQTTQKGVGMGERVGTNSRQQPD